MSNTWSGPGRALQFHLDLFSKVDRASDWIEAHAGKPATPYDILHAPNTLRQRLKLMTSMGDNLGVVVMDGKTVATMPDEVNEFYSQYNVARGVGLINHEYNILNRGETHYVSHHITTMIADAAEQCGDEPLFSTDLPCPNGLMVFEYPLLIPDLHPDTGETVDGLDMPVRAIAWGLGDVHARRPDTGGPDQEMETLPGIFYALYTDRESWTTLFLPSVERSLPDEWAESKDVYEAIRDAGDPMWCIDTSGWSFGKTWKRTLSASPRSATEQGEIHKTVAFVRRFILAMFRFEWQRILVPETYRPSRPEMKRAMRAGLKLEDGYVKILRLRRHVEAEARGEKPDSDPLAYDHQWLVRGHPRRQWFPSLGPARNEDGSFNVDSHRLIWIEPFVKGNPYAPLVIGHNVTAVVR